MGPICRWCEQGAGGRRIGFLWQRKTVRATHTWSKNNEVQVAYAKLCDAESKLIDDMQNSALMTEMSKAKNEFEAIRYEKEQEARSKIRSKMGANESNKLLHVLLTSDITNNVLLDIQHPDSSPCTKQEAAEVMVALYADVCSFPDHLSFNQKKVRELDETITNIEQNLDAKADEDNNRHSAPRFVGDLTCSSVCGRLLLSA